MARSRALKQLVLVTFLLFFLAIGIQSRAATASGIFLDHQIFVELTPQMNTLKASDHIRLPSDTPRKVSFLLHRKLKVRSVDSASKMTLLNPGTADTPFAEWGIELTRNEFTLEYEGQLDSPSVDEQNDGFISPAGAVLSGATYWYPTFTGALQTFNVSVTYPKAWTSLTQGQRTASAEIGESRQTQWSAIYPQQEIFLIAGPFFEFGQTLANGKQVRILLRKNDSALAQSYLNVIPGYLEHYLFARHFRLSLQ